MHIRSIIRVLGLLLFIESGFLLLALLVALFYAGDDLLSIAISFGITLFLAFLTYFFTKNVKTTITKREGYLIVALVWVVFSFFGALPFYINGHIPSYTDAFFETMSGFTTTGASILNDIEALPNGLLFWRSITQWMGGMGMILLSIAILPIFGIGGMQLYAAEVPGPTPDKFHPRVKETAKRLWAIYIALTLIQTLLLVLGGMSFFDALNHSFTTMATGGYSTKQASIAFYDSAYIQYVITIFMFFAGINFSLFYFAIKFKWSKIFANEEFRFYTGFVILFTIIITLGLMIYNETPQENALRKIELASKSIEKQRTHIALITDSIPYEHVTKDLHTTKQLVANADNKEVFSFYILEKRFRSAFFQVVSIITTTGFATDDYLNWPPILGMFIFVLMFFGGSAGSTGGGIKIVRIVVLFKNSTKEFARLLHPNAVIPVRLNRRVLSSDIVANILAFIVFYIFSFIAATLVLVLLGIDFETSMGASIATLGNIGPGIGNVGPADNFAFLPDSAKWMLSLLMLIGRLELFTVIIVFTKLFWTK